MTMTMIDIIKIMKKDDLNFFEACIILYPEKSFDEFIRILELLKKLEIVDKNNYGLSLNFKNSENIYS